MADWDSFRTFISDLPLHSMFKKDVSSIVSDLTEWLIVGIDRFIPSKKFQQKPNSQPWFSPECAAAIAHRNHFFHSYQRNRCMETKAAFRTASNHCKRVIKNARELYAQSVKSKVAEQRLGSHQFWQIANRILNRSVRSIPTIINGPEVISSASDKAKLFAKNFAANSTLCDQGHQLPVFPPITDNTLCNIQISVRDVAKLIKNLDSSKATGPDGIPIIVLKKLQPELAPYLQNCLSVVLRRIASQHPGKPHQYALYLRIQVIAHLPLSTDQ